MCIDRWVWEWVPTFEDEGENSTSWGNIYDFFRISFTAYAPI